MEIIWDDVKISRRKAGRSTEPFASVDNLRITFNSASCNLIDNLYNYKYAKLRIGRHEREIVKIAVVFLVEYEQDTIKISTRKQDGNRVNSVALHSKDFISRYFRHSEEQKTLHYPVEKLNANTLVIDIAHEY